MKKKIILTGGAGLVGQNLIPKLKESGFNTLIVIDKHERNSGILQATHEDVICICADLAESGSWQDVFSGADAVVMLQAQIGGLNHVEFERNNIASTKLILAAMAEHGVKKLVHVSSSVVNSMAKDAYSLTKSAQERIVTTQYPDAIILRPTLMFGWFDRKHLGWLSRFMRKVPLFPIPGNGKYLRQPLYAGDFAKIILSCLMNPIQAGTYDVSGLSKITYIDLIRQVKEASGARVTLVRIPYSLFYFLLWLWALFDRNPPFTTQQLAALVLPEEFPTTDWEKDFKVEATQLAVALEETFQHPVYSQIELKF